MDLKYDKLLHRNLNGLLEMREGYVSVLSSKLLSCQGNPRALIRTNFLPGGMNLTMAGHLI